MNYKVVFALIAIFVIGGVAYWLISPLFIEREVNESIEEIMAREQQKAATETRQGLQAGAPTPSAPRDAALEPQVIASGIFAGLAGHNAEGAVKLLRSGDTYYIRFEDDFRLTNGPDLFVHFGKNDKYAPEARLGALKGNIGSQNYEVPASISPSEYNEIWVWCRAFAVPFGRAVLLQ